MTSFYDVIVIQRAEKVIFLILVKKSFKIVSFLKKSNGSKTLRGVFAPTKIKEIDDWEVHKRFRPQRLLKIVFLRPNTIG